MLLKVGECQRHHDPPPAGAGVLGTEFRPPFGVHSAGEGGAGARREREGTGSLHVYAQTTRLLSRRRGHHHAGEGANATLDATRTLASADKPHFQCCSHQIRFVPLHTLGNPPRKAGNSTSLANGRTGFSSCPATRYWAS